MSSAKSEKKHKDKHHHHRHKHRRASKGDGDDESEHSNEKTNAAIDAPTVEKSVAAEHKLMRREATDSDRADWLKLEGDVARISALLGAARARRDAAGVRAKEARTALDAIDAKIHDAKPKVALAAANFANAKKSVAPIDDYDDDDEQPPPPPPASNAPEGKKKGIVLNTATESKKAPSPNPAAASASVAPSPVNDAFVMKCRESMANLLKNCASASKSGSDSVVFGDAARDAMLATKEILALVEQFCEGKPPATVDAVRDAANLAKERVVVLVRTGKDKLGSSFLGVSHDDPDVSDAVRNVALAVKALMSFVNPPTTAASSSAPARSEGDARGSSPLDGAAVAWDDVGSGNKAVPDHDSDEDGSHGATQHARHAPASAPASTTSRDSATNKWAGAAARARQEREKQFADTTRKVAEARSSGSAGPMTTINMPGLNVKPAAPKPAAVATPVADFDSDDDDDMFGDLDAAVAADFVEESAADREARRIKLQEHIDNKTRQQTPSPQNRPPPPQGKPAGRAPARPPPAQADDGDGDSNANAVADFVDPEVEAYEREQAANKALANAADSALLRSSSGTSNKHDRTNEQVRITVMYVIGGLDHDGAVCELALGAQTRSTARANRAGWCETVVFGRETKPSAEVKVTVRARDGGTPQKTQSNALKSLRTLARKVEATTKRASSHLGVSSLPIDDGVAVLSLSDEAVPFGSVSAKQCAVRNKTNRVIGELLLYVERCEPHDVSRRTGVPPTLRANVNAVAIVPCRYASARSSLAAAAKKDAANGGGTVPTGEAATDQDRRGDLALKYETPLQQACKWPPLGHKVIELLQIELDKLPPVDENDELADFNARKQKPPIDVEFHNGRYQTYLHFAAEAKRADLVARLLRIRPPPNPDLRDSFGASPLHIAAALNDAATIEALIKGGATIENVSPFSGQVPMHFAAQCGATRAIAALVASGAQGDVVDDLGCTPLHHAAYCGEFAGAQTLLADARAFRAAETRNGTTPMLLAALCGHADLVDELAGPSVAVDNAFGDTLLWGAVINADWPRCSKLVRAAGLASIDAPQLGAMALSCLERVLLELPKEQQQKLVPALLLAGAKATHAAADGKTPLHFAAYFSTPDVVKRLIAAGADVNAVDEGGNTALHLASTVENVRLLLEAGADIHSSNNMFNTPLHVARALHGEEVSRALVEKGADGAMANENKNQARELLRVGGPPGGIYFAQPKAPLVLPSECGGVFIPRLNEQS